MAITSPQLLMAEHQLSSFSCGIDDLDDWLIKKAIKNQNKNNTRVYVVVDQTTDQVVGYYAIAMGSILRASAIGSLRRNSPDPIPMVVLARLGVHRDFQHLGIGAGLLKDCVLRSVQAMNVIGGAGTLVHAIDESAKSFYSKFGFSESSFDPLLLMARTCDIEASHSN
ncbi:GNAT family N-acetyltransferase [Vibrio sp. S11_S32]|uniref:GNAT family N-acetyltransferase n=1 Tax=Vibrio sp. S11_S32 TaxID=2720225 RepID=UPI0016815233|nr:GNAT family N-acetyltransferase [Vibrio sp. S11_S32]MBD1577476.1 GNAT family N-acetyltransferase [Vibrio sp. S11_S32]